MILSLIFLLGLVSADLSATNTIYDSTTGMSTTNPAHINIVTHMIVCDDESYLPRWGAEIGDQIINANTAQNYVNSHPNCHFDSGWEFQYASSSAANPGDHVGEATGWTTFGPTDENGRASVKTSFFDSRLFWVRQVFVDGYLHFGNNLEYSSEMFCYNDNKHYDNYDSIIRPLAGNTYYCVAFTVKDKPVCEEDIKFTAWSNWENVSECVDGEITQMRTRTEYDANDCGTFEDVVHNEFRDIECTVPCVPSITNSSWSIWTNVSGCINGEITQMRTRTEYDANSCGIFNEVVHKEFRDIECTIPCVPNVVNSTWSSWTNSSSCINGKLIQTRTRNEYDANLCGTFNNITYSETKEINCSSGNETEECCVDENCTADYYGEKYCKGDDVYKKFYNFTCVNGSCVQEIAELFVKECGEDCDDGACVSDDDDDDNGWNDPIYLMQNTKSNSISSSSLDAIQIGDDDKTNETDYSSLWWLIAIFLLILLILAVLITIIRILI